MTYHTTGGAPARRPGAIRGFLAWTGELFARVREETGMMIDPDG